MHTFILFVEAVLPLRRYLAMSGDIVLEEPFIETSLKVSGDLRGSMGNSILGPLWWL